jgi:hypothetical protein
MSRTSKRCLFGLVCLLATWGMTETFASRALAEPIDVVNFGGLANLSGDGVSSLDLTGNFIYAIDSGRTGGTNQVIDDATFTAGGGSSFSHTNPAPNYAGDPDSAKLNSILSTGLTAQLNPPFYSEQVNLAVSLGTQYKLQILYYEGVSPATVRHQDLYVEGALAVDNLELAAGVGRVFTYTFVATDTTLNIEFFSPNQGGSTFTGGDIWTSINGVTLEAIPAPEPSTLSLVGIACLGLLRRKRTLRRSRNDSSRSTQ